MVSLNAQGVQTQMCLKKHRLPQDLEILNEVPCFLYILELSVQGKPRRLWASAAWLQHKGQTLEEFMRVELGNSNLHHWMSNFFQLGVETEIEQRATDFENVLYPQDDRPRRFLHCCRPIWFEGHERPSTLLTMFNTDNSALDATSSLGDPLNFHFQGNICHKTHTYPDSLDILNDVPIFTVLYDLKNQGSPRKLWANSTWLNYIGQTLEEFQKFDLAGNTSLQMREVMHRIGLQVQVERKVISFPHTVYAKEDRAVNVIGVLRPVMFEGMDTPLCLCTYLPQDHTGKYEAENALFQDAANAWNVALPSRASNGFPPSEASTNGNRSLNDCWMCLEWSQKCRQLEARCTQLQNELNRANQRIERAYSSSIAIRDEMLTCSFELRRLAAEGTGSGAQSQHTSFTVALEPSPGGTGRVVQLVSTRDYEHKREEMNKLRMELQELREAVHDAVASEDHQKELQGLRSTVEKMMEEAKQSSKRHADTVAEMDAELQEARAVQSRTQEAGAGSGETSAEASEDPSAVQHAGEGKELEEICAEVEKLRKELEESRVEGQKLTDELEKLGKELEESRADGSKLKEEADKREKELEERRAELATIKEKAGGEKGMGRAESQTGETGGKDVTWGGHRAAPEETGHAEEKSGEEEAAQVRKELQASVEEELRLGGEVARLKSKLAEATARGEAEAKARRVAEVDVEADRARWAAAERERLGEAIARQRDTHREEVEELLGKIARGQEEAGRRAREHGEALSAVEKELEEAKAGRARAERAAQAAEEERERRRGEEREREGREHRAREAEREARAELERWRLEQEWGGMVVRVESPEKEEGRRGSGGGGAAEDAGEARRAQERAEAVVGVLTAELQRLRAEARQQQGARSVLSRSASPEPDWRDWAPRRI